ncbi:MAG TPA: phosphatase PAP2 family protein [Candidatus Eisenbacteria bacterium]|nr:phosphatase PAP2 family protein [Candidatus Eisenbacteria bacterium]
MLRPVDRVLAAYNVVAGAAWLRAAGSDPATPWFLAAHLAGALLPFAIRAIGPATPAPFRVLREGYPLLLLYPFFAEVGRLHAALGSSGHDALVIAWDAALFPGGWHRAWAEAMPQRWLSETMHALYVSYYLLIAGPPLAAALLRRGHAFRDISFRTMLTYTACYAVYLYFPVFGPGHADPIPPGARPDGFFPGLMHAAMASGDSPGTAFPSSHVAGAFTAAWLGYRWFPRAVAHAQFLLACGVMAATVYTHNHYPLDAAAGLVFAWLLQYGAAPLLERAWPQTSAPALGGEPARVEP